MLIFIWEIARKIIKNQKINKQKIKLFYEKKKYRQQSFKHLLNIKMQSRVKNQIF